MRNILICAAVLLLMGPAVRAQETAPVEVNGGYQYLRLNPGEGADGINFHGWNAGGQFNVSRRVGIVAEFTGTFTNETGFDPNLYTFLFGPRYRFGAADGSVESFVHALFGAARVTLQSAPPGVDSSDTSFAFALGGGIDFRVSRRFSLRAIQLDYLRTGIDNQGQNNVRVGAGVVFRFGGD